MKTLAGWIALLAAAGIGPHEGSYRTAEDGDWFQFLGPSRDGKTTDTVLVSGWRERGLTECWRTAVGEGYSGVITGGSRLYNMDKDGNDEFIFSRRSSDGSELWRVRTGRSPANVYGGVGPRVTPTVDGELVFTVGAQGVLFALDARTGELGWQRDLKADLGWRPPAEGTASTPLVTDGRLFLVIGGGPGGAVAAFDRDTGETLWTAGDDGTSYSSPALLRLADSQQVLFLLASRLVSFDPETGRKLWSYDWPTYDSVNVATPIAVGSSRIFISSGYDQGAAVLEITRSSGRLQPREIWRSRVMKNHFNNSVHHQGVVYGFDESIFKAVDAGTGELLWRARGFGKGSLVVAADHLIVLGDDGELGLVAPSRDELEIVDRRQVLQGRTWTPPSVARGRLYLRSRREMVCLEPSQ